LDIFWTDEIEGPNAPLRPRSRSPAAAASVAGAPVGRCASTLAGRAHLWL